MTEIFLSILMIISFLSADLSADIGKYISSRFVAWSWFLISISVFILTFFVLIYVGVFLKPFEIETCICNCCKF